MPRTAFLGLIGILVLNPLQGRVDRGYVTSTTGSPVPYAIIQYNGTGFWVLSDDQGFFHLPWTMETGDTLTVSRYGYHPETLQVGQTAVLQIRLRPRPIQLEPVTVINLPGDSRGYSDTSVRQTWDKLSGSRIFQHLPGLSIRTYGGSAGNASLHINGGPAAHIKITLDDVDLTNPQNGETDISQIPSALLDQVLHIPEAGATYGSGAADGVIRIYPSDDAPSVTVSKGSFGYESIHGNTTLSRTQLTTHLRAGLIKDAGLYPVQWRGKQFLRDNNDFTQGYTYLHLRALLDQRWILSGHILYSQQDRGVSGMIQSPNTDARRQDTLNTASVTLGYLFTDGFLKFRAQHRSSDESYRDPRYNIASLHQVNSDAASIRVHWQGPRKILIRGNTELKRETISSTDAGRRHRFLGSFSLNFLYAPVQWLKIEPAIHRESWFAESQVTTGGILVTARATDALSLHLSLGTAFRYPSFNDLYWNPGGNPDLGPERTRYRTIETLFNPNKSASIRLSFKDKYSRDMIRWIPGNENPAFWKPENIARTRQRSFSMHGQLKSNRWPVQVQIHITRVETLDEGTGQALLYAPGLIGGTELTIIGKNSGFQTQLNYTGERLASYGSPPLEGYLWSSLNSHYAWKIDHSKISIQVLINNVLNREIISVQGYPEPGRSIQIALIYQRTHD